MQLFAHHMGVEFLGREFAPETPMEHAVFLSIAILVLGFMSYGIYSAVRDFRRWRAK